MEGRNTPQKDTTLDPATCQQSGVTQSNVIATLSLAGNGREVFTPALLQGESYRLICEGVVSFSWVYCFEERCESYGPWKTMQQRKTLRCDPFWATQPYKVDFLDIGNRVFCHRVSGFLIDGNSWNPEIRQRLQPPRTPSDVHEDREEHRYTARIVGRGEKVALRLRPPWYYSDMEEIRRIVLTQTTESTVEGKMTITIEHVPRECPGVRHRKRVARLRVLTEHLRNWADPEYRANYVRTASLQLIRSRDEIERERRMLFAKEGSGFGNEELDLDFMAYVELNHPDVFDRCNGKLEALLLAERHQLTEIAERTKKRPTPPPPPSPPPTPADVRSRVRREAEERRKDMVAALETLSADQSALSAAAVRGRKDLEKVLAEEGLDDDDVTELFGSTQTAVQSVLSRFAPKDPEKGRDDVEILE